MPPGLRYFSVGLRHSGESSLSPNEPSSSLIKMSPFSASAFMCRMSPEIRLTRSSRFSSMIMFLNVTIAFGFLSRAITYTLALAFLAAARALRISGPRPAPKYRTTILSALDSSTLSCVYPSLPGYYMPWVCLNLPCLILSMNAI